MCQLAHFGGRRSGPVGGYLGGIPGDRSCAASAFEPRAGLLLALPRRTRGELALQQLVGAKDGRFRGARLCGDAKPDDCAEQATAGRARVGGGRDRPGICGPKRLSHSIDSELLPSELDGKVRTAAYLVDGGQIGLYAAPGLGAGLDPVDGIVVIDADGTGYAFDLWQWMVPPTATAAPEFIAEAIRWAEVRAGVLYLSNSHMTYAADTKGANAYISAIDLASGELLWRSEPLASNARNFKVVGGGIVAGYGFTAEPDRVVVLDRSTGKVVQSLPLPSGPEAFGVVGDQIIVRCYDADVLIPIAVD